MATKSRMAQRASIASIDPIWAELREEADAKLGDGTPTFAQVKGLAQARAVSREGLRAYPEFLDNFIATRGLKL